MDEIIAILREYLVPALVAAFVLGGGAAWPLVRRASKATPTKVDDIICDAIDKVVSGQQTAFDQMTAEQLDKLIPDRTLIELVKMRKARWAAAKAAAHAGG